VNTITRLTLLLVTLTSMACSNQALNDPNFDLWCGDHLCAWTTEEGKVERVSTWHPKDYGVSLVGAPVKLSQEFDGSNYDDPHDYSIWGPPIPSLGSCMTFEVMGDVRAEAQLTVELDADHDGAPEYSAAMPQSSWTTESFQVPVPPNDGTLTVRLHKKGTGRAVLGRLSIYSEGSCKFPSGGDGGT